MAAVTSTTASFSFAPVVRQLLPLPMRVAPSSTRPPARRNFLGVHPPHRHLSHSASSRVTASCARHEVEPVVERTDEKAAAAGVQDKVKVHAAEDAASAKRKGKRKGLLGGPTPPGNPWEGTGGGGGIVHAAPPPSSSCQGDE